MAVEKMARIDDSRRNGSSSVDPRRSSVCSHARRNVKPTVPYPTKCPVLRKQWWKASHVLSLMAPNQYPAMGRSQLLVFCAEKVPVDSMQMTAIAIATGAHTLNHQRQPASSRVHCRCGLRKKTGRIFLRYQPRTSRAYFSR